MILSSDFAWAKSISGGQRGNGQPLRLASDRWRRLLSLENKTAPGKSACQEPRWGLEGQIRFMTPCGVR
jgi:hypothetical protein